MFNILVGLAKWILLMMVSVSSSDMATDYKVASTSVLLSYVYLKDENNIRIVDTS
jgi:hypothetical protein